MPYRPGLFKGLFFILVIGPFKGGPSTVQHRSASNIPPRIPQFQGAVRYHLNLAGRLFHKKQALKAWKMRCEPGSKKV